MQQLLITFAEVSDVERIDRPPTRSTVGQRSTSFSFVDQAGRRHAVSVHGHPRVEAEMRVIAVLALADELGSLLGWVDQGTGEIAGPEPLNLPLIMVAWPEEVAVRLFGTCRDDARSACGRPLVHRVRCRRAGRAATAPADLAVGQSGASDERDVAAAG